MLLPWKQAFLNSCKAKIHHGIESLTGIPVEGTGETTGKSFRPKLS
jgi:hypothetical protein